jgi:hypothetical protein
MFQEFRLFIIKRYYILENGGNFMKKHKAGVAIPLVMVVVVMVMFLGLAISSVGMHNLRLIKQSRMSDQALYAAEAGLQKGFFQVKNDRAWQGMSPEFANEPLPTDKDYDAKYSVWVWNNLDGSQSGPSNTVFSQKMPNLTTLPSGSAYILSEGKVNDGKAVKYVGMMVTLERTSLFQYAIFGKQGLDLNNINVTAYDSFSGLSVAGGDVGTNAEGWTSGAAVTAKAQAKIGGDLFIYNKYYNQPGIVSTTGQLVLQPRPAKMLQLDPVEAPSLPKGNPIPIYDNKKKIVGYEYLPGYSYGNLTVNNNQVVFKGAGQYSFSSISVAGNAQIKVENPSMDPVKIYVDGNITARGTSAFNIQSSDQSVQPAKVQVFCTNACTSATVGGNPGGGYVLYAPNADVSIVGNYTINGALVGKKIINGGNAGSIKYDVALLRDPSLTTTEVVKSSWQRF